MHFIRGGLIQKSPKDLLRKTGKCYSALCLTLIFNLLHVYPQSCLFVILILTLIETPSNVQAQKPFCCIIIYGNRWYLTSVLSLESVRSFLFKSV